MTIEELQDKLNQANEKVTKRKNNISKLCQKLGLDFDTVMQKYYEVANTLNQDYLPRKTAEAIRDSLGLSAKPSHDENGYWIEANYAWNNHFYDLSENFIKLFEVERIAKNWEIKLNKQSNRENVEKIPILVEFLDKWEERVKGYYHNEAQQYIKQLNDFQEIKQKFLEENPMQHVSRETERELILKFNKMMEEKYHVNVPAYCYKYHSSVSDNMFTENISSLTKELTKVNFQKDDENEYHFDAPLGYATYKGKYVMRSYDEERLDKILKQEKLRKYEKLVEQVTKEVGEITDVSNLKIDVRGDLNGIVVGTQGKAKVNTIGAGGYNIQIFHYRTLVKRIRE